MTRPHRVTTEFPSKTEPLIAFTCWCGWTWSGRNSRDVGDIKREHEGRDQTARDVVAFVRARLDEDIELATAAAGDAQSPDWEPGSDSDKYGSVWASPRGRMPLADGPVTWQPLDPSVATHMARYDPSRVLREVEAKRSLLDEYELHIGGRYVGDHPEEHVPMSEILGPFVLEMAAIWSDHGDFRKEWAS